MKRIGVILLLIATLSAALLGGAVVYAENDSPITMAIEPDPDCQLTEAGEMTFLRFTLKNNSNESYTLKRAVLSGELLPQALAFEEDILMEGNGVKEFKVQKLSVPLSAFDRELTFTLTWQEEYYLESDAEHLFPLYAERKASAKVVIERFSEPVLELSYRTDTDLVAVGEQAEITYILQNNTKFDMTGLSLYDPSVSTGYIPLESTELKAGEAMEVSYTFAMGEVDVVVNPCVEYTVRGEKQLAACESTYTIRYLKVELKLDIQQYPSTEDGTLFAITVTNSGTHAMKDIQLFDEIGTELDEPFDLAAGQSKSVTYTVAAAVSADSPRMVSFHLTAQDYLKKVYTLESKDVYEVKPYVASEQVNLQLIVTLTQSRFNEDGSLLVRILFEIRNYSAVPITHGVLTENSAFNGTVREYEQLNQGVTTFYKEFTIGESSSLLSFVLTAQDPAGNSYATEQMKLDMTSLLQRKQDESASSGGSQTIDTTGTIYDTEKYIRIFRRTLLVFFVLIVLLLAGSAILYVYEQGLRSILPPEKPETSSNTATGKTERLDADVARLQFGYVQPAKLRYMDALEQEASEADTASSEQEDMPLIMQTPATQPVSTATMAFRRPLRSQEEEEKLAVQKEAEQAPKGTDPLFRRPESIAPDRVKEAPVPAEHDTEEQTIPEAENALAMPSNVVAKTLQSEGSPVSKVSAVPTFAGALQQGEPAVKAPAVLRKRTAPKSMEVRPRPQVQPKMPAKPLRMGGEK